MPPSQPLTHIIGYFVIGPCHTWVHGSVQYEYFVIGSFEDNNRKPF
jgi:hypothetical protein